MLKKKKSHSPLDAIRRPDGSSIARYPKKSRVGRVLEELACIVENDANPLGLRIEAAKVLLASKAAGW